MRNAMLCTPGAAFCCAAILAGAWFTPAAADPIVGHAVGYELSIPVRNLPPTPGGIARMGHNRINPLAGETDHGARGTWTRPAPPLDPLIDRSRAAAGRTPAFLLRFVGTANPFACGGCSPPDTTGDVGSNHYIQVVNATKVAIFNKNGALLEPPFDLGSLWTTSPCNGNAGDPNVVYDEIANRWVLAQFAEPNQLCFAVSQTANPLGAYHLFTFDVGEFPDYFKVGVWPNGYYVSANETTYTAYAFDRTKMLAGDPSASFVKFTGETNFLMPADVDGSSLPGGGGLFYTFKDSTFHGGAADRIELFRLTPDFVTPASSTFALIKSFNVAPFTYTVCGFFHLNCVAQGGTGQKVDVVSEWPMQRFAYRRFPDHQSLVGNFTVGGGSGEAGAAIRWFELRAGASWTLFQEGTFDPGDGLDRFMGSIAMDKKGGIALGYSASDSTTFPSIRYASRPAGAALGTLQAERVLRAGGGSQTGSNRWGDYSAMSIDPTTGCRFWYTNEYYNVSSATSWQTAVGVFALPGC